MSNQAITLPQLTNDIVVSARKTRLCAYSVALEGWRRGLTLKWYTKDSEHFQDMVVFGVNPPGRLFSLTSKERTHYFFRTRGDKVTNEAVEIGSEKDLTKKWLEKSHVPVPQGFGFGENDSDESIIEAATSLPYPLVLKPTNGSLGNGVVTNIKSEQALRKAIKYVRHTLGYKEVVLEQHVSGSEYRIYVIEDKVIAAYNRLPANIIGDGLHTIEELIALKNLERKKNARLHSCLIEADIEITEFLENAGYTYESIPPKGEKIYLREKTNVSSGGDPIDVTDSIGDYYKEIAINAVKAIPGLYHGGVDIIVDDTKPEKESAVVIELNPTAQIGGILFPLRGKARDIPKAIIDYYFPETKGVDTSKSNFYFDFLAAMEPLENRSAIEVEVSPAPKNELVAKKYILSGEVNRQSFHNAISLYAQSHGIHGEINKNFTGEIELIVGSETKEALTGLKSFLKKQKKIAKVEAIQEEAWKEPIKIGFDVNENFNTNRKESVHNILKRIRREYKNLNKEVYKLEKDNVNILNSRSWKFGRLISSVKNLRQK
ncbi:acylphosphatase [Salipaludibacillus agaradhaerens]|uniref:acylphosphatase n=1 Tax=Salipaludibacillus agaradhaerens TaxID=76935 RepID=UPI0021516480|nr:acylphosphatase [Salipaludibacillus agaradhaerens]MCR6108170.1 acylphosphatase [Salipaludibacillus agaradhaerens]MCR6120195.1 acylphosphatase [Salipaludibacillus agaradhaerens]